MPVNCLDKGQKQTLMSLYMNKQRSQKELALSYGVSERTIHRVIVEYGVATPTQRIQDEAYQVLQVLKKHSIKPEHLDVRLDKPLLTARNVQWFLRNCPESILYTMEMTIAEQRKVHHAKTA